MNAVSGMQQVLMLLMFTRRKFANGFRQVLGLQFGFPAARGIARKHHGNDDAVTCCDLRSSQ